MVSLSVHGEDATTAGTRVPKGPRWNVASSDQNHDNQIQALRKTSGFLDNFQATSPPLARLCGQIFCYSCSNNFIPGKLVGRPTEVHRC